MTVTLVANISANGKVLLAENPHHQVSQEAIRIFGEVANRAGNLVVGKHTFEFFRQFPGGAKGAFPGTDVVVLSTTEAETEEYKVVKSPEDAITYLAGKGFRELAVGGGTRAYNAFLNQNLVTDLRFNMIPILTGSGGVLVTDQQLDVKFNLVEQKLLTDGIVQFHLTRA